MGDEDKKYTYDPKEWAAKKQASRDQDEADLKSGKKTAEQLQKENTWFNFPDAKFKLKACRK